MKLFSLALAALAAFVAPVDADGGKRWEVRAVLLSIIFFLLFIYFFFLIFEFLIFSFFFFGALSALLFYFFLFSSLCILSPVRHVLPAALRLPKSNQQESRPIVQAWYQQYQAGELTNADIWRQVAGLNVATTTANVILYLCTHACMVIGQLGCEKELSSAHRQLRCALLVEGEVLMMPDIKNHPEIKEL